VKEKIGTVGGVDVWRLLEVMNARIRFLYDRDHQIGHSFFLKARDLGDLRRVFLDSVIPLLQEYFYGSWDKTCAVLGCPYDEKGNPVARRSAGLGAKLRYSVPLVVATPLGEMATLGYDHPDYESDKVDYEVNPRFEKASLEELRAFFMEIIDPGFEAGVDGKETAQ
jgi:5-methylcytosine-specific restriction protein B